MGQQNRKDYMRRVPILRKMYHCNRAVMCKLRLRSQQFIKVVVMSWLYVFIFVPQCRVQNLFVQSPSRRNLSNESGLVASGEIQLSRAEPSGRRVRVPQRRIPTARVCSHRTPGTPSFSRAARAHYSREWRALPSPLQARRNRGLPSASLNTGDHRKGLPASD